jgi:hypothetical protein
MSTESDTIRLDDMIQAWVRHSHRMNVESFLGVRVDNDAVAEGIVNLLAGGRNHTAAIEALLATAGLRPAPAERVFSPGTFVVPAWDWGSTDVLLVGYRKGAGEKQSANGMRRSGTWANKLLPRSNPRLVRPATTTTIRNFTNTLIRSKLRFLVTDPSENLRMSEVIQRWTRFSVAAGKAAFSGEKTDEQRAKELARICASLGCQREHAAGLLAAMGHPDPTPYVRSGDYEDASEPIPQFIVVVPQDERVREPCLLVWHEANAASNTRWKVMLRDGSMPSAWINVSPTTARPADEEETASFFKALAAAMRAKFGATLGAATPAPAAAAA